MLKVENYNVLTERLNMNELGKKYSCDICKTIMVCIKASEGSIICHNQLMQVEITKKELSSSMQE